MASALRVAGSYVYIPSSTLPTAKTITGITKASPGVFTSTAHGLSNGDVVYIDGVVGMTEVNGIWGVVSSVATNTFQLTLSTGVLNTSSYTTYSSGGTAQGYTMALACETKNVNFSAGSVDQVESTGMCDSTKTYEPGLGDVGSFTISANKLPQGATQISLRTFKTAGTKFPIKVIFPNPSVNGGCVLPCFVQQDSFQGQSGGIWTTDFVFKQAAQEIYYV